jgi:hypothetical protein
MGGRWQWDAGQMGRSGTPLIMLLQSYELEPCECFCIALNFKKKA